MPLRWPQERRNDELSADLCRAASAAENVFCETKPLTPAYIDFDTSGSNSYRMCRTATTPVVAVLGPWKCDRILLFVPLSPPTPVTRRALLAGRRPGGFRTGYPYAGARGNNHPSKSPQMMSPAVMWNVDVLNKLRRIRGSMRSGARVLGGKLSSARAAHAESAAPLRNC